MKFNLFIYPLNKFRCYLFLLLFHSNSKFVNAHLLVEQDVGRLQDRVAEQAERNLICLASRLRLELSHVRQLRHTRNTCENPRELPMIRNLQSAHIQRLQLNVYFSFLFVTSDC